MHTYIHEYNSKKCEATDHGMDGSGGGAWVDVHVAHYKPEALLWRGCC